MSKSDAEGFLVDEHCHPQTIDVVRTRAAPLGIEVEVGDPAGVTGEHFGVLVQYPGTRGELPDLPGLISVAHQQGAYVSVAADLLALCLVAAPGDLGADAVVGSAQRFGVPLGFGGPHAAFIAVPEAFKRSLPGRLVSVSRDGQGRAGLRLALQTREQHIRREKATSNICTAQALLAGMAAMYGVYHGPDGLRAIAQRVHRLAVVLAAGLREAGLDVVSREFFDTITVRIEGQAQSVVARAAACGINLRRVDDDHVGVAVDETTTPAILADVWASFGVDPVPDTEAIDALDARTASSIPNRLERTSSYLDHSVFHEHRSETGLMRYLRRLADRDLALDRTMIPLGSCTMKLNSAVEMEPISWPELAGVHPFAPLDQTQGWLELIGDLEQMLVEITGYDAVSLQPNAGSQGELAGLLAIRRWHDSRGDQARRVCLIPSSAHGTNAATAVMAGMAVVVVDCDGDGNVDLQHLEAMAEDHAEDLAALMVTYPSTHGVFEEDIVEICELIHRCGGQVYLDGANLNAMVGIARPGRLGADVSHLNLHKTFCIPHGGGGPGVGPIGVRAHLAPFLPNHVLVPEAGPDTGVAIAAAPWGSAGILPISWAYITLMGAAGLTAASQVAILNANYLAAQLDPHFPVLYRGRGGLVAHECILDLRPIRDATGVTVEDVAKRLIDYGFHAPTMSFPVPGTFMVEPTESESKAELDRFIEAMVVIRAEIDRVASGHWSTDDNPLRRAPHTAEDVVSDGWERPYTREEAAFPVPSLRQDKYWPPVGRIEEAWGDRHLACGCPALDTYR